jgi:hypothetical protein
MITSTDVLRNGNLSDKTCLIKTTHAIHIYCTQRFCSQHLVRLVKLQEIFLTRLHADAIGGLLGMFVTCMCAGMHLCMYV